MQSQQSVRVKGLLMGVNPAINKHEVCKQLFVSVWLYCCCDDNVIYSHRHKIQAVFFQLSPGEYMKKKLKLI